MKKVLVILGPTATGKTDLALNLAKKFKGEIIACDSRQVYQGLDIGTGKIPSSNAQINKKNGSWEIDQIKIWMYDLVGLETVYTVADYIKEAQKKVKEIQERNKLPIIVGGTGLYLKALLEGLPNLSIPVNESLRKELEKLSVSQLQDKLKVLSPSRWQELNSSDRKNPRRLLRSIELIHMNPYISTVSLSDGINKNSDILKIGLTAPREVLYQKVDLRILDWFNQGIINEVKNLLDTGITKERFKQLGLEYSLIAEYITENKEQIDSNLVEKIKGKLHGYVRRQITWFKKEKDVSWFDITDKNCPKKLEKKVNEWYD